MLCRNRTAGPDGHACQWCRCTAPQQSAVKKSQQKVPAKSFSRQERRADSSPFALRDTLACALPSAAESSGGEGSRRSNRPRPTMEGDRIMMHRGDWGHCH